MKRDIIIVSVAVVAFGALVFYLSDRASNRDIPSSENVLFRGLEVSASNSSSFEGRIASLERVGTGLLLSVSVDQHIIVQGGFETRTEDMTFTTQPSTQYFSFKVGEGVSDGGGVPSRNLHARVEQVVEEGDLAEGDVVTIDAFRLQDDAWIVEKVLIQPAP
jgi:hypothetical protein